MASPFSAYTCVIPILVPRTPLWSIVYDMGRLSVLDPSFLAPEAGERRKVGPPAETVHFPRAAGADTGSLADRGGAPRNGSPDRRRTGGFCTPRLTGPRLPGNIPPTPTVLFTE